jgi:rSAM/selenodomain-associated transferase 1
MSDTTSKLIVFTKAPVPGTVKTRLQPTVSAEDAAILQAFFIQQTLSIIADMQEVDVELCCFPEVTHPFFLQCAQQYGIAITPQQGEDIGERMANAIQEALATYRQVVVIGTDCPELTVDYLNEAFLRLVQGSKIVLGPAIDGGYVLLGLQCFSASLFTNINWGSDQVLLQTRTKLRELGWQWDELQQLRDIDTPDDLIKFPAIVRETGISMRV